MTKALGAMFAAGLLIFIGIAWYANSQRRQLADARGEADRLRLQAAGQIVAAPTTQGDLNADVAKLAAENTGLRAELAKAMALGARATATVQLATAPVPVIIAPREPEAPQGVPLPPCPGGIYNPDGMGGFFCQPPGAVETPTCLLASTDTVSFHATEIELRSTQGSRLLTGTDELWRETPAPRAKLAQGTFSAALSDVATLEVPKAPGWGALAFGLCTSAGCGAGAGAAFPPQKLLGLTAEPFLAAFSGGAGTGALGGLAVRW